MTIIFIHAFCILQRTTLNETKVFLTKDQAQSFCINFMNESAGYKACLGVPNVTPENAIADCVADIQVLSYFFNLPLNSMENMKNVITFYHYINYQVNKHDILGYSI